VIKAYPEQYWLVGPFAEAGPGAAAFIGSARNGAVPPGIEEDIAGEARFQDDPTVPDTGAGPAPVVDLGAYER